MYHSSLILFDDVSAHVDYDEIQPIPVIVKMYTFDYKFESKSKCIRSENDGKFVCRTTPLEKTEFFFF